MNKPFLLYLFALFFLVAFLGTGCADSTSGLAGTAEETNEMAEGQGSVSSASENPSSSSESPNKAELSSSSLMISPGVESSSNTVEQSSSGAESDSKPGQSASTPVSGRDPNSFIAQYGIPDLHYDNSVLAATVVRNKTDTAPSTSEGDNNSSSLDFDKPGIYKLPDEKIEGMKTIQNKIEKLKADGTCSASGAEDYSAYVLVVAGDGRPNVLTSVSANSMTVTIVEMEGCSYSTEEKLYAFLFVYCSNVNLEAEIVKETKTIEKPAGKCIDLDFSTGWVNRQY
ncbi:MAG: hypothetical protein II819_09340 [Fibrobacter sp.]|nr:hypothetical protein [Fibrobacter sp.]